jgi:hypothetical protein
VDYAAHTVAVAEMLLYPNRTGGALAYLVLAVEPNLWPGCFALQTLTADRELAATDLTGQQLTVIFAAPLLSEETVELTISYTLDLPRVAWGNNEIIRNLIFGYTAKQMNLLDWYPFIVPYAAGEGWLLHKPGNYGEHLVYDTADFDVNVRFPDPASAPVAAAPAEGEETASGWRYRLEEARTFALSLSPDFEIMRVTSSGIIIQSYYFYDDAKGGELVLQTAAQAVDVYGKAFAPYPHPVLTIVQGDFIPSMEYDGLVFVGHTFYHYATCAPRDYLSVLTAHEVAHQWWFALVGDDQAMEPWLDEALATYSERIFYEAVHPEDADWWQEIRLTQREPLSGWVDTSIYDLNRSYPEAVYLRGAKFLGDLRQCIGDEAFSAFLKDYAGTFSQRRASADDFFRILHQHTQADISDIIGTYFSRSH